MRCAGTVHCEAHIPGQHHCNILIPVFNDWHLADIVVQRLDAMALKNSLAPHIVLVDDGSTAPRPEHFLSQPVRALRSVEVVHLRKNLGHQRALSVGLVYLYTKKSGKPVVIMDADGEDAPEDVAVLYGAFLKHQSLQPVFAARIKRAEGLVFRAFYRVFQVVHWVLLGFGTRIGNFSVLPWETLERLVVMSETWNHYAASVVKSRVPMITVPLARAKRIGGHSTMGLVGLITHGLSAIAVYGDVVGVRLLIASSAATFLALCTAIVALWIRFMTSFAIPAWAIYAAGLLTTVALQALMISLIFTFIVLYERAHAGFLPFRDCPVYIRDTEELYVLH